MRWNIDPIFIELGPLPLRWYGLFFATGLLLGINTMYRSFQDRGLPREEASSLSWVLPVGMIVGAHLIHLIFYEPRSFIDNPIRIIEIGHGLASHGGGLGAVTALYLFARRKRRPFHVYADAVVVGAVWVIPFVRIGNFFNSEIYGRKTDVPWAVIFERIDDIPRHPSQIYEAALGFILVGLAYLAHAKRERLKTGVTLYLLLGFYFVTRFLIEYVKEYQAMSADFPLTMGQMLSTPIVVLCAVMAWWRSRVGDPLPPAETTSTPASAPAPGTGSSGRKIKRPKRRKKRR